MAESHAVFYTAPPAGNDTTLKQKNRVFVVGAASLTNQALGNVETPDEYVIMVATTACHVRFGIAGAVAAATSSDFYMPANTIMRFKLKQNEFNAFSVIQDAAGGFLHAYLPG